MLTRLYDGNLISFRLLTSIPPAWPRLNRRAPVDQHLSTLTLARNQSRVAARRQWRLPSLLRVHITLRHPTPSPSPQTGSPRHANIRRSSLYHRSPLRFVRRELTEFWYRCRRCRGATEGERAASPPVTIRKRTRSPTYHNPDEIQLCMGTHQV